MGEVPGIVKAVLYLESAVFVTGETVHVDGGADAGHWYYLRIDERAAKSGDPWSGKLRPVSVTLVGDTGDQLQEKSRFQKASHWPFSLR
jgi:hypothetical protein